MDKIEKNRYDNCLLLKKERCNDKLIVFADKVDRRHNQISSLIGKNPTKVIGKKLARHFEECFSLDIGWLDIDHNSGESNPAIGKMFGINPLEVWDETTPLRYDEIELPYYKEVELAAGSGSFEVREDNGHKLRFVKSTLNTLGVDATNAACVRVTGNSMEPVLQDGSTVGVDTSRKAVVDGKLFAVEHGGMLRVKYLYRVPDGIRLRSANSAEHPDETCKTAQIRIIGQVFWRSSLGW